MKKSAALLLVFAMLLSLMACGAENQPSAVSDPGNTPAIESPSGDNDYEYPIMTFDLACQVSDPASTSDFNVDGRAVAKFSELVAERSGGNIEIVGYYGNVLGADAAGVVLDGGADIGYYSITSNFAPLASCFNLPGLITDLDMAWDLMQTDGELYKLFYNVVNDAGFVLLSGSAGCMRQFFNNTREVHLPEDMTGMNVRVYTDNTVQAFFSALAIPVTLPASELYTGMSTGTLDGLEFVDTAFITRSLHEVTKYYTDLNWQWQFNPFFFMSQEVYDTLDPQVIALLEECAAEAAEWHYLESKVQSDAAVAEMESAGMVITKLTPEERAAWAEFSESLYDELADKIGPGAAELIQQIKEITNAYKADHGLS